MHVLAFLVASSLCNPCADPELVPPVVDVGMAAAGGGVGGLSVVATVLYVPFALLQLAAPDNPASAAAGPDDGLIAVVIGGVVVVYGLGAGISGALRSNARGFGNPFAVGVVSTALALASVGGAFATGLAVGGGPGSEVIFLGVIAGGALLTGVGAGITAAATE